MDLNLGETVAIESSRDSSFFDGEDQAAALEKFFARPILIKSYTWTSSGLSPSDNYFDPWTAFMGNNAVKFKFNNYAFASFDLKLKFVVNAAPFYYGALIASYQPLPTLNTKLSQLEADGSLARIFASQRPNLWMLPQSSQGGEITLPFFYQRNWIPITNAAEVAKLGRIYWTLVSSLTSANGATTNGATIQVFAWAENIKLAGPTVSLSMQNKDEYATGPVSAPASSIAAAARYFTKIPLIGKFARATEIGASAISKIAILFGWSNVPVISNVMPFKSLPFHTLSSAHISEPVSKLTLDPKSELTVDPRTAGLGGQDELSIPYIVQKESYLTQFNWSTSNASNTLLFQSLVTPCMFQKSGPSTGGTYTIDFTPMGHVSQLFNNWHGDIVFRFKMICSKFHRGRLQITWDPVGDVYSTGINSSTNTAYTRILDITDMTDISIRIPYIQSKPWAETTNIQDKFGIQPYEIASFTNKGTPAFANGVITVRVLTNLSAPLDTASVTGVVFVKGADNLEFANPVDIGYNASTYKPQNNDEAVVTQTMIATPPSLPERYKVNYGEAIPSVRILLRRAALVDVLPLNILNAASVRFMIANQGFHKYPPMPGFNSNGFMQMKGWETPGTSYYYSYTKMTPFNWMQDCFVACRGAMRWHFNVDAQGKTPLHTIRVARTTQNLASYPANNYAFQTNTVSTGASTNVQLYNLNQQPAGLGGQVLTNQLTQTSLSVELPQMNNNRFVSTEPLKTYAGSTEDNTDRETYILTLIFKNSQTASDVNDYVLERYASIGTDFNFFWYLNAPRIFVNTSSFDLV